MGATAFFASTTLQVVGQQNQAKAQANALKGQANIADYNSQVAKINAESVRRSSTSQQLQLRRDTRQQLGRERAFAAQSGTGFGGSNKDLLERSETLAELDALNFSNGR